METNLNTWLLMQSTRFKSYYVVWKQIYIDVAFYYNTSLNRTM